MPHLFFKHELCSRGWNDTCAIHRQNLAHSILDFFILRHRDKSRVDQWEIRLDNHRFPGTGSITELSDQHPIRVTLSGPSIITKEYVPWHVQELQVSFEVDVKESTNEKLSTKNVLSSPIVIGLLLVGIFVVGIVTQRIYDRMAKSDYDIVLDDDEDEDDDSPYYEEEIPADDDDDEFYEDVPEEVKEPVKRKQPRRRTSEKTSIRTPVESKESTQAKDLLQKSSNEVVRKRRARQSQHDTVKTKRRKLSDTQPIDVKPRKRRAVKRDVASDNEMDETLKRFVSESPEE